MDMKRQNTIRAFAAALSLLGLNLTVAGATDVTDDINPADFTVKIDNPFFPCRLALLLFTGGARN